MGNFEPSKAIFISWFFLSKAKKKKMANEFPFSKWIFFATSNFAIIEDMASGLQGIGRIKSILCITCIKYKKKELTITIRFFCLFTTAWLQIRYFSQLEWLIGSRLSPIGYRLGQQALSTCCLVCWTGLYSKLSILESPFFLF